MSKTYFYVTEVYKYQSFQNIMRSYNFPTNTEIGFIVEQRAMVELGHYIWDARCGQLSDIMFSPNILWCYCAGAGYQHYEDSVEVAVLTIVPWLWCELIRWGDPGGRVNICQLLQLSPLLLTVRRACGETHERALITVVYVVAFPLMLCIIFFISMQEQHSSHSICAHRWIKYIRV